MYMVGDIFKFIGMFVWVSIAFAAGLYAIYHNYNGMEMVEGGVIVIQNEAFNSLANFEILL